MAQREHYSAEAIGPVTTTSNASWADLVELAFTPTTGGKYVVFWSGEFANQSNTSSDYQIRITVDGSEVAYSNNEQRATTEYASHGGFIAYEAGASPSAVSIKIQIKAETNGNTIAAKRGRLTALLLTDEDHYAESLARQTSTSTTMGTAVGVTFTPTSGGDYLILGSGFVDGYANTAACYTRLEHSGSGTDSTLGAAHGDLDNVVPVAHLWKVTLGSESQTVNLQFRSHGSGSESAITGARIVALRADAFDAVHYGAVGSDSSGKETSYTDALTLTETVSANPHLVLGTWYSASDTNAVNISTALQDGGVEVSESIRRSYAAQTSRSQPSAVFYAATGYSAGSRTWELERKSPDGAASAVVKVNSAVAVLDLGSSDAEPASYEIAADTASFALTGTAAALKRSRTMPAGGASCATTGSAATLRRGYRMAAAAALVSVGGSTVVLRRTYAITATGANIAASGTAAALRAGRYAPASTAGFAIIGADAVLARTWMLSAAADSIAVDGSSASARVARSLSLAPGAIDAAGAGATLLRGISISAASASTDTVGSAATLRAVRLTSANGGSIALTGQDAALAKVGSYAIEADAADFALTGADASFVRTYRLAAQAATTSVAGSDATLSYGAQTDFGLDAEAGSISLTGADAEFARTRAVRALPGTAATAGATAALKRGLRVGATDGDFAAVGGSAGLLRGFRANAETGGFSVAGRVAIARATRHIGAAGATAAINGSAAGLLRGRRLSAASTALAVVGGDVEFLLGEGAYLLQAEAGAIAAAGADVEFVVVRIPPRVRTSLRGGGPSSYGRSNAQPQERRREAQAYVRQRPAQSHVRPPIPQATRWR